MRRTWLTFFTLALAALCAPQTLRAQGQAPINSYTATYLGNLGADGLTTAYGLNDSGEVVGSSITAEQRRRAFLWQNGVMLNLGVLPGGDSSEAAAINNSGQVVGYALDMAGIYHAFLWTAGTGMRDLGTLGGPSSQANGVNDAGQVVGEAATSTGSKHACLWQNGRVYDLGTLTGGPTAWSTAHLINRFGQVVGVVGDSATGTYRAFRWTPSVPNGTTGTMVALQLSGTVSGINAGGQLVGGVVVPDGNVHAVCWDSFGTRDLGVLSPGGGEYIQSSHAYAINDSGLTVGSSDTGYYHYGEDGPVFAPTSAFVWDSQNGMRDLNVLAGGGRPLDGYTGFLGGARGVNASGQVAANAEGAYNGSTGAYLLTPSPTPLAPWNLRASVGDRRVGLSWGASTGAESYKVKRTVTPGGGLTTVASGVTGTAYVDTAVVNGTTYYYVVSAVNAWGESENSEPRSARPVPIPTTPTGLTATAGDHLVNLSWDAGAWVDSYQIYRSTTPGGPYERVLAGDGNEAVSYVTTYVDVWLDPWAVPPTQLENGVRYYYVIVAVNIAGTSPYSDEAGATPRPPPPPPAPTGLTATAGDTQVSLAWEGPDGFWYNIKRATTSGGPYFGVGYDYAGRKTYTDSDVTNGTTYYYVVSATNSGGESPNSSQVRATPTGPPPPAPPTGLTATPGKKKVDLAWTKSSSAGVTQYRIYRSTASGGSYALQATVSAKTSFTDTALTSGTTYYYVVTAMRSGKESASSNVASARPK